MEKWKVIREFPNYSVSNEGKVRNDHTGRILSQSLNQQGIPQVGLTNETGYHKRAVAPLVAHAFIPRPFGPFDTPINLDGDRTNNRVENLMWRPRWFAVMYHKQFKHPYEFHLDTPIIDLKTQDVSPDSLTCAKRYGLLEQDIVLSIGHRTYVWPTYQRFVMV